MSPVFLMQRWLFGTVDNVANFDPVIFGRFGWFALWVYYFAVASAALPLIKRCRTKPTRRLSESLHKCRPEATVTAVARFCLLGTPGPTVYVFSRIEQTKAHGENSLPAPEVPSRGRW
jgi:hypothetical protein